MVGRVLMCGVLCVEVRHAFRSQRGSVEVFYPWQVGRGSFNAGSN